jgi:hypothetical protein
MWPSLIGAESRSCAVLTLSAQRTRPRPTQHEPERRDWRLPTKRSASYPRTTKLVQVPELKLRIDRRYYVQMAGIGEAASIIAVVQITAQISKLCSGYLSEVKSASKDVERLQSKISSLHSVLEKIEQMLRRSKSARLTMSTSVLESLKRCVTDLEELKAKLDAGKRKKPMSRIGLRSLKWPFTRKEVEKAVEMLEGYTTTFSVALLADNMLEKSIRVDRKTS